MLSSGAQSNLKSRRCHHHLWICGCVVPELQRIIRSMTLLASCGGRSVSLTYMVRPFPLGGPQSSVETYYIVLFLDVDGDDTTYYCRLSCMCTTPLSQ
jgi:hypothetical protein